MTTDRALLRAGGSLARYDGVLIAGAPQFAPVALTRALVSFVRAGGRLAWFGTGGFSREIGVTANAIVRGERGAFLGERVRIQSGPRALVVLGDRIDFFGGVGGAFGPFPRLESSLRLQRGSRLVASAGAEPARPAVVVYRFGRGLVARIGVDGFARALDAGGASAPVAPIMPRLWALLSR